MTDDDQLRTLILDTLGEVAPDADIDTIDPDVEFHDQFDFDSMDFLNFATALHRKLKVDIPETDYLQLGTLNACFQYLRERIQS